MVSRIFAPVVVRLGLGTVAAACALLVATGRKPWETLVAARHAAGKVAPVHDYVDYGLWYGGAFAGVAALLLLVTSWWWLRPGVVDHVSLVRQDHQPIRRRIFWVSLGALLLLASALRLPRMGHSFWGDEDWAYRDLIGGRYTEAADGSLVFRRHRWMVTAFWDKGTNNQYAYTLLARVCHDTWKRVAGARPEVFSEAVLRVPSLIAGLGSIVLGALLLRRLGFSRAGLILALMLAIHPWHVRYSSEARGYTMLIFFLIAGIYFLLAALEGGRWRSWLLFGCCEFLALYTWKAAVHPVAAINLAAFVVLLVTRGRHPIQYGRWLVANVAVLMLFVPLFAPAIPQIRRKLNVSEQAHGSMDLEWFKNVLAQLVAGVDFVVLGWWVPVLAVFAAAIGAVGFARLRVSPIRLLVVAPVAGSVLAFLHFHLTGNELLKWYVFYTLPFFLILLAVGLEQRRLIGSASMLVYAAIVAGILHQRICWPIQQSREAAAVTRTADEGALHMGPTDIVTVGLYRACHSYDPRMRQSRELRSGEALMEVVRECRAAGKALRVSAANLGFARHEHPDFFAVLEDSSLFRKSGDFPAAEAYLEIVTYEMVPP